MPATKVMNWLRPKHKRGAQAVATIDPANVIPDNLSAADRAILESVRPYTMTSCARLIAMIDAARHVATAKLPGDVAECGVWRGGSMMAVAKTLLEMGDTSRTLYLYDTYEGMTAPSDKDVSWNGAKANADYLRMSRKNEKWCHATIEDVRANLLSTGYPADKLVFVQGKVEDTIPATLPGPLALLRLDTDWYESTKHELKHLWPLLRQKGLLVIDDYGHWQGAKQAVDEMLPNVFLHRIDYTGRLVVKS
jgi:O-methyltransferase